MYLLTNINHLYAALLKNSQKDAWLGLNNPGLCNNWRWMDGSQITYLNWKKGQPNTVIGNIDDCVFVSGLFGMFPLFNTFSILAA